MCLATMAYAYLQLRINVAIFSTDGKFQPISYFTELHALTQAPRSYVHIYILHFILVSIVTLYTT